MHNPSLSPDGIASALGRATNWFQTTRPSRGLKWALLIAASLYFAIVILFQAGPVNSWGADVSIMLDGSWRIYNGQIPYRDFYLALGPIDYSLIALGMSLTNASPQAIAVGNAIFGAIVGSWGWFLCRRRLPFLPSVLVTAWLILLATSSSPLGVGAHIMSPAMIYNRHGYAILSLILLECAFFLERSRFWGGVSSGAALILLAFLKLNFFCAGVLLILATISIRRSELPRVRGLVAGAASVLLVILALLRFAIIPFLWDMRYAIQSRIGGVGFGAAIRLGFSNVEMISAVALTIVALMLITHDPDWNRFARRYLLLCGAMVVASLVLRRTDYGENGYQLATLWVIILIARLSLAYWEDQKKVAIPVAILLSVGGIFVPLAHEADAVRTLISYQSRAVQATAAHVLGMPHMSFYELDLATMAQFKYETGSDFASYLNDGVYLLRKWTRPDESILTLGYNNPFPYLLRRKPALGGSPWLHEGNDISKTHPLDPELVFGDADLIMLPESPSSHRDSDLDLQVIYHQYLVDHFSFVAGSTWWKLYRRKR